ncbi:MAG TPA: chemotaxis protein CheA [Planctomycetota bacterium]|nr:chemotaxis protein CheA [Planctomycetota bacterium]
MKESLDRLVEAFLLTDVGDLQGLKVLRHRLEELLPTVADPSGVLTLVDLGTTLDLLISGKAPDRDRSWASVEKGLLALQDSAGQAALGAPRRGPEPGGPGDPAVPAEEATAVSGTPSPDAPGGPVDREILEGFVVEAREHLDAAEAQLLSLETDPARVDAIHTVFRAFHTIKGAASCLDLGSMQDLSHETETLLDSARRGELVVAGATLDLVFEAVDAMKRLVADVETQLRTGTPGPADATLGSLILRIQKQATGPSGTGAGAPPAPPSVPASRWGDEAMSGDEALPSEVPAAVPAAEDKSSMKESVRVDADRLDHLVDLIGELVIAESMVSQSADLRGLATSGVLGKSMNQLDKITRELQEIGMSLRMVPVRPLFQKMARLSRDLSRKLAKPVEFVTSGEEIEIDKAIVNSVADALVHLLRNALDHGLERDAEERRRAGKPDTGRLELRAVHREGSIVIEVEDDGRGLDREAILAKGVEKGLVPPGELLSDDEIFKLIFLPGFSTATVVTEWSGRGVGLDVVRTSVEALRGRIEVQSRRGQGTIFRLRLPLTLAIIDGMVIRAGHERFIVPTVSITRLVRPEAAERGTAMGKGELLSLQDEVIPLFRLKNLLVIAGESDDVGSEVVVVVEDAGKRAGLIADEVLGQQQIVIKSLGLNLEGVPGISGGVILPDGQVGLILDVAALLNSARTTVEAGARFGGPIASERDAE